MDEDEKEHAGKGEGENRQVAERVLSHRMRGGCAEYKIRWKEQKGQEHEHGNEGWMPETEMTLPVLRELMEEFWKEDVKTGPWSKIRAPHGDQESSEHDSDCLMLESETALEDAARVGVAQKEAIHAKEAPPGVAVGVTRDPERSRVNQMLDPPRKAGGAKAAEGNMRVDRRFPIQVRIPRYKGEGCMQWKTCVMSTWDRTPTMS